jgi:hypothetical protein
MNEILLMVVGAIVGFVVHAVTMKVGFKQRTIENKIKVYDSLFTQWVKMRNFVYAHHPGQPIKHHPIEIVQKFDKIYGESQQYIGEAFLVIEDTALTADINNLNERMYRTEWLQLPREQANELMEKTKIDAIEVISRMREDIKGSTRFDWQDFVHIFHGFRKKKPNT